VEVFVGDLTGATATEGGVEVREGSITIKPFYNEPAYNEYLQITNFTSGQIQIPIQNSLFLPTTKFVNFFRPFPYNLLYKSTDLPY